MVELLGDRIRLIRKTNRLSQNEFASKIGISQAALSELEKGKYSPSLDTILTIHKAFKVNISWLIVGDIGNESNGEYRFNTNLNKIELELIEIFKKLNNNDKTEIIDIAKLKITRYK